MYVPLVSCVVWGLRVVSTTMPPHYDSFTKIPNNNTKKATELSLVCLFNMWGSRRGRGTLIAVLRLSRKDKTFVLSGPRIRGAGHMYFLRSISTTDNFRTNYLLIRYLTLSKKTEKYEPAKI